MNEELQAEILSIVKGTKEFVVEQAPDTIQQFLGGRFLGETGWLLFSSVLLLILVTYLLPKVAKSGDDFAKTFGGFFTWAAIIAALYIAFAAGFTAIKIKQFPKAYLLEWATGSHRCGG